MQTRRLRSGQAAVFVALCLMALLLVIAFATNTGIVTNDRIRMQETADLATYAVAYSEAASLNDVTLANKEIAEAVKDCRRTLENGGMPWETPCTCGDTDWRAELAIYQCRIDIDDAIWKFTQAASYDQTVKPALDAGEATAEANFTGTGAHTTFFKNISGSPTHRGTYNTSYSFNIGGGGRFASIAEFEQVVETAFNYQFTEYCDECEPTGIAVRADVQMATWFYKGSRDPDVWVAGRVAGTPEKRFLDTDYRAGGKDNGYFGGSSTGGDDMLVSYAVAKPYDGSVGPSELSGNQQNGNTRFGVVYGAAGVTYPKMSMVDEYRARMAGIQDSLSGDTDPVSLISQDGAQLGKSWDTSKFEH